MKRLLFMMSTLVVCVGYSIADEIVVPNIILPKGGTATLDIQLNNEQVLSPVFEFYLRLPEGVTVVDKSERLGARFDGTQVSAACNYDETEGRYWIMAMIPPIASADVPIPGQSGTLVTVELQADDALEENTVVNGFIEDIEFKTWYEDRSGEITNLNSSTSFTITIGQPADTRVVLDETSTTAPTSATNVDVRVKRTIKADEWSTICLPFAMTEAQVKEAFGDNVQLGEFNGVDYEFDSDDVVGITVNFTNTQSIEANHPYIIKVSQPVSEFTLDGVDIVADEDEAYIEFDNGKTGSRRVVYSGFYGTYHAQTVLDKFTLFLSDNKFWYSMGQTAMKAFRAYFEFLDVLSDVENASNIKLWVNNNDEDRLQSLSGSPIKGENTYNLAGQRVGKGYKGIVIESGKKTIK